MTTTIWHIANAAIAQETEVRSIPAENPEDPPQGETVVLRTLARLPDRGDVPAGCKANDHWTRPLWRNAGHQPATVPGGAPADLDGLMWLRDVYVNPPLGAYDRLGAMDAGTPDLEEGTMTWTWAVISADAFDPATHHQPVWDDEAGEWLPPVAKDSGELAADLAAAKAVVVATIKAKGNALVAAGMTYDLPGNDPADPHVYAIADVDQANMLAVQVRFSKGGEGCHGGHWRCNSNHNVDMTDAQVQAFFDAAYAYKMGIIRRMQALADAVRDAADATALAGIDVDAGTIGGAGGWPANG